MLFGECYENVSYMESIHTSFLVLNKNHRNNNHQQTFCVSFSIIELYIEVYITFGFSLSLDYPSAKNFGLFLFASRFYFIFVFGLL